MKTIIGSICIMYVALIVSTIFVMKFLLKLTPTLTTLQSKMLMFVFLVYTIALGISLLLRRILFKHNHDMTKYFVLVTIGMFCGFIIACPVFLSNEYYYNSFESEFMIEEDSDDDTEEQQSHNLLFFIGFTFLFGILAMFAFMKT